MNRARRHRPMLTFALVLALSPACDRELRRFRQLPALVSASDPAPISLQRPAATPSVPTPNAPRPPAVLGELSQRSAYDVSEGARLFGWYNCSGCHANGGGGIGPPLMDAAWYYGSDPADVFTSIVEGRANGMPAFRGKIPDYQVWQLVGYVRSLAGLLRRDIEPGRSDSMAVKPPESMRPREEPRRGHHGAEGQL